jgi:hypothetical protein
MNENLKKLLRNVFSIDTKAGYKMRYHITRALACEDYAKTIDFNSRARGVVTIFEWAFTPEGYEYWRDIRNLSLYRDEYI